MIIKQLVMKNFGKFTYRDITFRNGMNIVYGPNEAGKSTVHSFIRGMLFGMDKKRGRVAKDNLYDKYKTWEGSTIFSGHMQVEDEGILYDLSRVFNTGQKEFQCVDAKSGRECVVDDRPEFLEDMSENRYRNSISNEQTKSRVDKDLASELKNYIANLSTSKDKEVDVSMALQELSAKKRMILRRNTAEDITVISKKVDEDREQEIKLDDIIRESTKARNKISEQASAKEEESIRIIKEYVDEYDDIKHAYKELVELQDMKKMNDLVEDKLDTTTKPAKDKTFSIILGIICCSGVLMCFSKFGAGVAGIFTSVLVIVLTGALLYLFNDKVTALLVTKECEKNMKNEKNDRENRDIVNQAIIDRQNIILEYAKRVCPLKDVNDEEMLRLDKEINVLKNQVEGHMINKEKEDIEIKHQLEKYNIQIDMLEKDSEQRRQRKLQLEELKEAYNNEKQEVDALNIAMDTIGELSKNIHYSVSGELNELISKYCNILTWGKYSKVKVDNEFNISVFSEDRYIDIEKLSIGTIEQMYLAVRLAVTDLFWPNKHLPIILDESFAFYDNDRLKATLKALSQMVNRQIIIFTCHMRELQILEDEGIEYNYVEL